MEGAVKGEEWEVSDTQDVDGKVIGSTFFEGGRDGSLFCGLYSCGGSRRESSSF